MMKKVTNLHGSLGERRAWPIRGNLLTINFSDTRRFCIESKLVRLPSIKTYNYLIIILTNGHNTF